MTRSHNIAGCEATEPHRRLIDFSQAHGSIVMLPPPRRAAGRALLTFAAGAVLALLATLILTRP